MGFQHSRFLGFLSLSLFSAISLTTQSFAEEVHCRHRLGDGFAEYSMNFNEGKASPWKIAFKEVGDDADGNATHIQNSALRISIVRDIKTFVEENPFLVEHSQVGFRFRTRGVQNNKLNLVYYHFLLDHPETGSFSESSQDIDSFSTFHRHHVGTILQIQDEKGNLIEAWNVGTPIADPILCENSSR